LTTPNPFQRFLDEQGFVLLDGGFATALEAAGHLLDSPLWSARLLLDAPHAVLAAHTAYLEAGADCVITASYQASFEGFAAAGLAAREAAALLRRSVDLAREAKESFWSELSNRAERLEPIVAASVGPYGAFLADGSEYDGRYRVRPETLVDFHRERLLVLADTDADLVAFETIPSLPEAEVLAELLTEVPDTWAWITFSCRDERRLWDGSKVTDAVRAVERPLEDVSVRLADVEERTAWLQLAAFAPRGTDVVALASELRERSVAALVREELIPA